jgi:hypothetical protein
MNPLEIKLLNKEVSFFQYLDGIIDQHPVFVTLAIFYVFVLLVILVIVNVVRRRAKGLIKPGPRVIYIQSPAPPPPQEEPPFDPFPPMRERDYEYERLIDPDYHED